MRKDCQLGLEYTIRLSISLKNHQLEPIFVEDSQQSLTIYNYLFGEIQRGEWFLLVILENHPRAQRHFERWVN